MAKATRKSTRLQKTKQDPDFLSGLQLEDLEDQFEAFKFPSLPPLSPSKSPSSQKKTADSSPRKEQEDVASGGVDQRLQVLQLEKEKLELELQVLRLRDRTNKQGASDDVTDVLTTKKKRHVDWPHEFIPGMSNNAAFDKIDQPEFFAGFLCMIKTYEPALKSAMISLLELLSTKAMSYSWPSVRSFYASVAKQVELCRINWSDLAEIKEHSSIFFRHSDLKPVTKIYQTSVAQPNIITSAKSSVPHKDHKAETDKACKFWNYKGACKCDTTASNYATSHVCRVCAKDHPMLHCPKRRHPIPEV